MVLTFPVIPEGCVPEVMTDLVASNPFNSICGFKRVQHDTILLHLSPVHLQNREAKRKKKKKTFIVPAVL